MAADAIPTIGLFSLTLPVDPSYLASPKLSAARLVVVDAIDETAASFYRRHGFVAVPGHPLRLYRRMSDIRASLGS